MHCPQYIASLWLEMLDTTKSILGLTGGSLRSHGLVTQGTGRDSGCTEHADVPDWLPQAWECSIQADWPAAWQPGEPALSAGQVRCPPKVCWPWLSLFLLLTVTWTWVWQPRAQWVAPGSRSQVTMALNRLSPAARSISVSAQTGCAVRQILAAALLLREVIWVGCLLAFSLKCHLWGVIFYLAKYSNKKSHGRTSQGSILCSLA